DAPPAGLHQRDRVPLELPRVPRSTHEDILSTDPKICFSEASTLRGKAQCDDYPFSSTYEGANKGDNRYSARLIDGKDNGGRVNMIKDVLATNRILDNDPFYVTIVP
ncbi:NucA/NucB deoxyribonuclease domain-containing protein, partial [Streptomyces pyridomyceticus]|uniref:NucA/NucB deoxyribonuclease domain-containing protein n=1 Tax=Streptomyces TaxID=1883 RepID=UPI003AF07419